MSCVSFEPLGQWFETRQTRRLTCFGAPAALRCPPSAAGGAQLAWTQLRLLVVYPHPIQNPVDRVLATRKSVQPEQDRSRHVHLGAVERSAIQLTGSPGLPMTAVSRQAFRLRPPPRAGCLLNDRLL